MVALDILITFLVLIVATILFVTEFIPVSITALGAAAVLMVTGVVSMEDGFSGFSNEATITVLSMLVIAAAVNRSGLVLLLAHKVLDIAAGSRLRFLVLLMVFAGATSAFLANTPIVAMLIPLVITVSARLHASASRFLIPMAFATTLGGMVTLVGTSTNILASSIADDLGFGPFAFFQFAKVGVPVTIIGVLYLTFVGQRILPERHRADKVEEHYNLKEYVSELLIKPESPLVGQRVDSSNLKKRYDIDFLRIVRAGQIIDQPLHHEVLQAGDVVLVRVSRDEILKIREDQGVDLRQEVTYALPGDAKGQKLAELIVAPGAWLAGSTLANVRFRGRYDAVVLAVRKRERYFVRRLSTITLDAGDALLVAGTKEAVDQLKGDLSFIVTEEMEPSQYRWSKIPIVLAIFLAVILASAFELLPIGVAALSGVVLLVVTGCLQMDELQKAIPWHLIFLLAGLIPLGVALSKTGAATLVAESLAEWIRDWPPLAVLTAVYAVTLLLTELMSNNASVAIMIPFGVEIATALNLNPYPFILAATFGASLAFMSPIGYQTYLMVYGPGEYKFMDFFRVGAPLNIICMITSVYLLNLYWPVT